MLQGDERPVFLDLEAFIGDTPALNSVLDVIGHMGNSCCHLCKFTRRSATLTGSRYTGTEHHGFISSFGRSFYQQLAVRDCGAKEETSRLLGMKFVEDCTVLPVHTLRTALMNIRYKIPKTDRGIPILSGHLDPYRVCLVAPDHLLTGHGRDCINLALKLLPSRQYSTECEGFMIAHLSSCCLPTQNRLVDHEKRSLHS